MEVKITRIRDFAVSQATYALNSATCGHKSLMNCMSGYRELFWTKCPEMVLWKTGGASRTLTLSSTSSTRPKLGEAVLNGLFPWNTPPLSRACYPINLVCSCGSRWKKNLYIGTYKNSSSIYFFAELYDRHIQPSVLLRQNLNRKVSIILQNNGLLRPKISQELKITVLLQEI
jgi:hypothetical protein